MALCCKRRRVPEDEEFESYAHIINSLMTTLRRPEDRDCAQDILMHCTELSNSENPHIRRHNNAFVCYFVKVLYTTASTQPLEIYDCWYSGSNQQSSRASKRVWLEENKSYFAMEKTPDGAVMFYSAVATDPKAGWDKGGLKKALQQHEKDLKKTKKKAKSKKKK